eukprot:gene8460-9326_t
MNSSLLLTRWGRVLGKKLMKGNRKWKEPKLETNRWNILRGDLVQVIQGPQAGQQGKVLKVIRPKNRVIIDGVNMRTRHLKASVTGTVGKKVIRPCTIHYSNVMLVDPTTGQPTKVSRKFLADGTKVRVSKRSGQVIPKPDLQADRKPRSALVGVKDTAPAEVFQVTFPDYSKYLPFIYKSMRQA